VRPGSSSGLGEEAMTLRRKLFPTRWTRSRRVITTAAAAVLALVIAGLGVLAWPLGPGSGPEFDAASIGDPATGRAAAPPSPGAVGSGSAGSGSDAGTDQTLPGASIAASPADPQQVPSIPIGSTQRSLVRTAQLAVTVDEAEAATRRVRAVAAAAGGLIVTEQTSDGSSSLVLRVPADALDRVIDDIATLGRVTARSGQVVDSTAEVVDLDARVASQQASVARVRALLSQATSIGDIVSIESELARREADLDSLTGRLAVLRDQVALSTLSVDLRTPSTPPVDNGDDRAAGFVDGLQTGWRGLVAIGTAMAAVLGFALPFLPVLALLGGLAALIRRQLRARRAVAAGGGGRSGPGPVGES
jgi:Domain of unknown function (DUF4349)